MLIAYKSSISGTAEAIPLSGEIKADERHVRKGSATASQPEKRLWVAY